MNDLGLPPDRPLPPHVRDRILAKVRQDQHRVPRRSMRAPLSIAAAVALLAAAAFTVTGTFGDRGNPVAQDGPAELERCWAAVENAGRTDAYPDRGQWRVLFSESLHLTTLTGIEAEGSIMMCETSLTSVSLSAPVDPADYRGEMPVVGLMSTRNGTVVGFAEDGVQGVAVGVEGGAETETGKGSVSAMVRGHGRHRHVMPVRADGVFVTELAHHDITGLKLNATTYRRVAPRQKDGSEFPLSAPRPEVSVTDRPAEETDRSSPEGAALARCLRGPGGRLGGTVVDAGAWRAGARFQHEFGPAQKGAKHRASYELSYVVAVHERATSVCATRPAWHFQAFPAPDAVTSSAQPVATVLGDYHFPGLSVVGVTGPEIARVELSADGVTVPAEVHERTFATFVPGIEPIPGGGAGAGGVTVKAYDADGALLHEGPLPAIPKR